MTPSIRRPATTLLTLSGLTALYLGAYKTAVGCTLLASYVALSSIKELPKERRVGRLVRSASAPELTLRGSPPEGILSVVLMKEVFLSPLLPLPPEEQPRLQTPSRPRVKVSDLPRANKRLWNWSHRICEFNQPATLVGGVIDTRYMPPGESLHLDWEEFFGTSEISVEKGGVAGAAQRLGLRKGGWVIFPDTDSAYPIQAQLSEELRRRVLIVLGGRLTFSPRSLSRIDFRFTDYYSVKKEILKVHLSIRDGGEIRLIRSRKVARPFQEWEKREEAELGSIVLLPPREEIEGDEHHLIYRVRPGRGG